MTIEKNNKRYISYSELFCFYEKGQDFYFKEYIMGLHNPPNEAMKLGSIIHKMIEDKNFDWKKELEDNNFTADYIRTVGKINISIFRFDEHELKLYINNDFTYLYAGIDAIEKINDKIIRGIEYKSCKNFWTQERVNECEQLTHYIYCLYLKTKEIIPFKLICLNTKNGKIKEFETYRTKEQLNNWEQNLLNFKIELEKLGWWDKKLKMEDRITI